MEQYGTGQRREQRKPSYITSCIKWLRLKNYQYEVSSSLYMLTPTEKLIFNMIILVLISMFMTAAYYYLPGHLSLILNRVWYYVGGELGNMSATAGTNGLTSLVKKTQSIVATQATQVVEEVLTKAKEL